MSIKKSQKTVKREKELPGLKQVDYQKIVSDIKKAALAGQKKFKHENKK